MASNKVLASKLLKIASDLLEASPNQKGLLTVPEVGATVRYTGAFLRSTGQTNGTTKFKVIGTIKSGKSMKAGEKISSDGASVFILVNKKQPAFLMEDLTEADLASMSDFERETIQWTRINASNLEEVGKPSRIVNHDY